MRNNQRAPIWKIINSFTKDKNLEYIHGATVTFPAYLQD